jgi:hypothetical protein
MGGETFALPFSSHDFLYRLIAGFETEKAILASAKPKY